ncbi:MAG: hypothetical protein R6U95_07580 [Bacteroidales bacterium]
MKKKLFISFLTLTITLSFTLKTNISKEKYIQLYNQEYKTSYLTDFKWNGSKLFCNQGVLKEKQLKAAEKRINFFRKLVGLHTITLIDSLNHKAQHAAFLILKNNKTSHYPTSDWKCYIKDYSRDAAGNSNIGFYDYFDIQKDTINPIDGFIEDYGNINIDVGHRRWILYSQLMNIGYGSTPKTEAVYILQENSSNKDSFPKYIAYPPNGYISEDLIFPKFSFSIPEINTVDFSKAEIKMYKDKKPLSIRKHYSKKLYGDPTIIWEVNSLFKKKNNISYFRTKYLNTELTININNVIINGISKDFMYTVTVIPKP